MLNTGLMNTGTEITKKALTAAKNYPVNVFADDGDSLLLLIHHMTNSSTDVYNIDITNAKRNKENVTVPHICKNHHC